MNNNAETLFEYLRDTIYSPADANLPLDKLDQDFRDLGEGLQYLGSMLAELREFSTQLGRGNLDVEPPSRGNELASPLKSLQASLRHMTWQTQQVAKGDYKQKVEFLGEFADAFNTMTMQLDQRQQALIDEIEKGKRKTLALEQSTSLLEAITDVIPQWIFVMPYEGDEPLFINVAAKTLLSSNQEVAAAVREWISQLMVDISGEFPQTEVETSTIINGERVYFSAALFPIHWREHRAVAFIVSDVSEEKSKLHNLENVAYRDALTDTYSRHFGMRELQRYIDEKKHFSICFVDVDGLKYVNDKYGHPIGDEYIIAVARALQEFPDGILSRLGGDEFMLLSEGMTYDRAEDAIAAIRGKLVDDSDEKQYLQSISYGIYEVKGDNTLTASELLSIVDDRMYRFKRAHKRSRE